MTNKLLCIALLALAACTSTGQPDWPVISTELELSAQDLRDAATLIEDERVSLGLVDVADALDIASANIAAAGPPATTFDAIETGLDIAEDLLVYLDEHDQPDARVMLLLARSALRRIKAYAPHEELIDDSETN